MAAFPMVLALVAIGYWALMAHFGDQTKAVNGEFEASLAVMLFREIGQSDEAYFGEGLALELASELSRIEEIRVASNTSTLHMARDESATLRDIGKALEVDYVIEGTFSRQADALRVTVELVDPMADRRIWAQSYDRPFTTDSFLRVQDEMVSAITSGTSALTRALRGEIEDIPHLSTLAILHWNLNHFVVLTAVTGGLRGARCHMF